MQRILLAIALLAAVPASAQVVFKCRDAKGSPVYQSQPCPSGQHEKVWLNEYRPLTAEERARRADADARIRAAEQAVRRANARFAGNAPRAWTPGRQPPACSGERAVYDAAQRDFRLNRNIETLRMLEARLRACELRQTP